MRFGWTGKVDLLKILVKQNKELNPALPFSHSVCGVKRPFFFFGDHKKKIDQSVQEA